MEKKFRIISLIFIFGCIFYYAGRFIYYYNKYAIKEEKKVKETLAITVQKNNGAVSTGDGLYNENGTFVFKGTDVDNYLKYSNIMWRIVKINSDNTITLVSDDVVNSLAYSSISSDFTKSNINDWLNKSTTNTGIFGSVLNSKSKYLTKTSICLDNVLSTSNITCKKVNKDNYISILGLEDYLNSINTKSYMDSLDKVWLYNSNNNNVWYINNGKVLTASTNKIFGIKPVITLKNNVVKVSGNGTVNNPYTIEKDSKSLKFNSYVKLDNDTYRVIERNPNYTKLALDDVLVTPKMYNYYSTDYDVNYKYSVAYYLNNEYYNSLKYKNSLVSCDFYNGTYSSIAYDYKDTYKNKVTAKVGLIGIADINISDISSDYYYMTPADKSNIYAKTINGITIKSSINKNNIRPVVCIKNDVKLTGKGTKINPFEIEV